MSYQYEIAVAESVSTPFPVQDVPRRQLSSPELNMPIASQRSKYLGLRYITVAVIK
jgi:hypothetical protein